MAETAARRLELAPGVPEGQAPGALADVGARLVGGGQVWCRPTASTSGSDGRQVDLLDRGEGASDQALDDLARFADRAYVTRGGDHRHVVGGSDLQRRVQGGHLGMGVAVLAPGLARGADRR